MEVREQIIRILRDHPELIDPAIQLVSSWLTELASQKEDDQ